MQCSITAFLQKFVMMTQNVFFRASVRIK